ncbi:MAG: GAF domain-containing protein [Chloroflexi bacterium]|nr:GAF domain-containing protein [Chloroflexota bacterium]
MNFYLILPVLAFGFNLGLIPLVLRGNHKNPLHRIFSLFLLSMSFWGLTIYKMRSSPSLEEAYVWELGLFVSLAACSLFFFHSTFLITQSRARRGVLPAAYLLFVLIIPLVLSGLVVKEMHKRFYGYAPTLGPLFPGFLIYVYVVLFLGFVNLIVAYRETTSHEFRNRYGYVVVGVLSSVLGATTDYLPVLGVPIYPLGIVGNIMFSLFTTVAILRHKLLDIRIAIRKGVAYSLLSALLGGVYVGVVFLFNYLFNLGTAYSALVNVLAMVSVAMLLQPVVRGVQKTVDRWFYRGRYDHLRALERFGRETKDIIDLDHLASSLVGLVSLAMQVKLVALLQPSMRGGDFVVTKYRGTPEVSDIAVPRRSPLLPWIQRQDRAFSADELYSCPQWQAVPAIDRDIWLRAGGELHVPLKSNKALTGLLVVGRKESGEPYSQEDVSALQTVAYQAATSMENARLYQELKMNLEELRLKEAQLIESAKLASVGTLAAGVAHEVNNPIFAISGRAELLLDQPEKHLKSKKAQEHVQVIYDMAKRISTITQDLLSFSRDNSAFEEVDLNKALDVAVKLVGPNLRRAKIEVVRDYSKNLPLVPGVPNKLQQVFMNLILNAHDAMAGGGTIKLKTAVVNGCVALDFNDTGGGMTPEVVNRLFDPFFTTKEVGKGTGLGLYVSQQIIQQHRGRIQVETEPGKGSTFTVLLPVTSDEPQTT